MNDYEVPKQVQYEDRFRAIWKNSVFNYNGGCVSVLETQRALRDLREEAGEKEYARLIKIFAVPFVFFDGRPVIPWELLRQNKELLRRERDDELREWVRVGCRVCSIDAESGLWYSNNEDNTRWS